MRMTYLGRIVLQSLCVVVRNRRRDWLLAKDMGIVIELVDVMYVGSGGNKGRSFLSFLACFALYVH
jgi:hypothetical protein